MPNKLRRDKRGGTRKLATSVSKRLHKPHSVKEVLGQKNPTLTRLHAQADRQSFWKQWLAKQLPAELTPRLSGVVERDDTLVIFTESAAWSARLRYLMQELEASVKQAQPTIKQISIRVMPKS
jgi:hypothetical protein